MDQSNLQQLVDYHYWARNRLVDAVARLSPGDYTRDLGSSFPSIRDTLVHLYGAEWIWCERWQGRSPSMLPAPDTVPDVPTLRRAWGGLEALFRSLVDGVGPDGAERVIEYRDLKGQPWRQPLWQIVQHVVNHGSYHRGQVTTMLRQLRAAPAESMDLIAYYRVNAAPRQ